MRKATPSDAARLAALHALAFEKPWSSDAFEAFLTEPTIGGLVAGEDGFILWRAVAGEAEILTLSVVPDLRRQGVGSALLDQALRRAREAGATEMFLEVSGENDPAIGLYRSAGFEVTGVRKAYYETENQPQDALTMRLSLTGSTAATITGGDDLPPRS